LEFDPNVRTPALAVLIKRPQSEFKSALLSDYSVYNRDVKI